MSEQAEEALLAMVKANPSSTVAALIVEASKLGMKIHQSAGLLQQLSIEGKIRIEDADPPKSLWRYARSIYSLWFWAVVACATLTASSIYMLPQDPPYIYLRYVLGSLFVLYLPGYTLIEALYPLKEELSGLERLALSIGLSLALTPLVGLALNYTPWGIRLNPIFTALSLLSVSLATLALNRKFSRFKLAVEPVKAVGKIKRRNPR